VSDQLFNLKKKVQTTSLAEVEIELIAYKNEVSRLRKLLEQEHLNQEKAQRGNYIMALEIENANLIQENNKLKFEHNRTSELVRILKYKLEKNESLLID
jgi:hypothetical protein